MKSIRFVGLFVGTLAIGLVAGATAGVLWSQHAFAKRAVAKPVVVTRPEVDLADKAADTATFLAWLRLNQTKIAIGGLEQSLHAAISRLAEWNRTSPPDKETRQARDKNLVAVKIYLKSFPVKQNTADIAALFSLVPDRDMTIPCKGGVCRLDDLRIAQTGTRTNSP